MVNFEKSVVSVKKTDTSEREESEREESKPRAATHPALNSFECLPLSSGGALPLSLSLSLSAFGSAL